MRCPLQPLYAPGAELYTYVSLRSGRNSVQGQMVTVLNNVAYLLLEIPSTNLSIGRTRA